MNTKVNTAPIEGAPPTVHPRFLMPTQLVFNVVIAVLGAIIGMELITRVGITPNTSIIGALVAILLSYIPLKLFSRFKSLDSQTLVQTSISGATFSAASGDSIPDGRKRYADPYADRCRVCGHY